MNRATLFVLSVFVLGLGFLAWRQTRTDATDARENDVALFEGLDENAVTGVRIDNVERDTQMSFERDPKVGWLMTDPVRVRAESGVLDQLVRSAVVRRATPVPAAELDTRKLGLEPPRIVFELITKSGQRAKVEVGAVDLDQGRVHVRVRGRVLRAVRDFEAMLDLPLDEYRSHAATTLEPRDVVEIHRRGSVRFSAQDQPVDVTLDALLDTGDWRSTAPIAGLLDPLGMSIMAQGGAGLRFDRIVETAGASLASFGLDPPALTIEFTTARGESAKILFGQNDPRHPSSWNGTCAGAPVVWRVASDVVFALATRVEELLDHRLHRFQRAEISALQLSTAAHEVRLEKGAAGWVVAEANAGSRVFAPAVIADTKRVEDFLGALDKQEIRSFLTDTKLAPDEARDVITFEARGATAKGTFGAALSTGGVRFLREGDAIVGVVDEAWLDLVRTPAQAFWSASILETSEVAVVRLAVAQGAKERVYDRDRNGVWVEKGKTGEARELHAVLDPLLFLRAARFLESNRDKLVGAVRVTWTLSRGDVSLDIGRVTVDGAQTAVCDYAGRRAVLVRQDVLEMLTRLFE